MASPGRPGRRADPREVRVASHPLHAAIFALVVALAVWGASAIPASVYAAGEAVFGAALILTVDRLS